MNEFNKYKLLSEGKAFGDRAKIALVLLDSSTVYEDRSKILNKFFIKLQWMPKREDYSSTKSYNNAWGYFAELLAVAKENNHPEFNIYYEIATKKGMSESVFERKLKELAELKQSFVKG